MEQPFRLFVFVVFVLFCGRKCVAEFNSETSFRELVNAVTGEDNDALSVEAVETILNALGGRIPKMKDCFKFSLLRTPADSKRSIYYEGFVNISRTLNAFILLGNCSDEAHELSQSFQQNITQLQMEEIVDGLRHADYESDNNVDECFNAQSLHRELNDSSEPFIPVILYLYKGRCILPEKSYFRLQYLKYFEPTGNDTASEALSNLLSSLNIGGYQASDSHGHQHENDHNHDEKEDEHSHDGSEHNEVHDDSEEDDDRHDEHSDEHAHGDHQEGPEHEDEHEHEHEHEHAHNHGVEETESRDNSQPGEDESDNHNHSHHGDEGEERNLENEDEEDHHDEGGDDSHGHDDHDDHTSSRCFSSQELLDIFSHDSALSKDTLIEMCPALVQQIRSNACNRSESSDPTDTDSGYTTAMIYGYGTASVAIISLLALLGFVLFPVIGGKSYKLVMQFFIGLGIGTMTADALIHIIPGVLGIHVHDEHDHEEEDHEEDMIFVWKMSVVFGGIYIFYFFENCLRLWKRTRNVDHSSVVVANCAPLEEVNSQNTVTSFTTKAADAQDVLPRKEIPTDLETSEEMISRMDVICFNFTTTLITVFVGDILHNFADGVAIGVSFTSSWTTGVGTSLAVLCHELPHEFGDFAIYLKNGATKWQAIALNFGAACCAFIGLYSGIALGQDEAIRSWLMAAVAGMFLYIALVQVMNEMVHETTTRPGLQFLMQNLGLLFGWAILLVIALYEDDIEASITG